ncbi:stress-induced protein sti1 [Trypanosoma rangeli]|uniref:Stress-induced protein sti1 n=1 Tax=Trypanosoma rangeli TaxID=5698 RepID=A0A422NAY7_TRYRA|nr:stress-induced protein sti1 [Trypanosoma rangeli]RNF02638.1 stress-induced protein sti1 [Trypanosoma rangeli]|eukprot:RNF02638.1 stress-induced protein sti1 [Trypanosoma rangeli]
MLTMSDERLEFMRSLGITEEDVLDPSLVTEETGKKKGFTETRLGANMVREPPLNVDCVKTTRAVFPIAEPAEFKPKLLKKERTPQSKGNDGIRTTGLSPEQLKVDGNRAFEDGHYREALNYYTDAIECLLDSCNYDLKEKGHLNTKGNDIIGAGFGVCDSRIILLAALFSNRSACYLQAAKQIGAAEALESAIRDADRAVELRPTWFKGYSRQGDAFFKMKKYHQATEAYEMALQFEPGNNNLIQSVKEARQRGAAKARESVQHSKKQATVRCGERNAAPVTFVSVAVPASAQVSSNSASTGMSDSGQYKTSARQLWNEFKSEVEASVHQPTGDDYRREQLRLFREQKERERSGVALSFSSENRSSEELFRKETETEPKLSGGNGPTTNAPHRRGRNESIPPEFSSDVAVAYQQRLLEEYRRRKLQRMEAFINAVFNVPNMLN